jgi:hypothetical protein
MQVDFSHLTEVAVTAISEVREDGFNRHYSFSDFRHYK